MLKKRWALKDAIRLLNKMIFIFLLALLLAACGGSGGSGSSNDDNTSSSNNNETESTRTNKPNSASNNDTDTTTPTTNIPSNNGNDSKTTTVSNADSSGNDSNNTTESNADSSGNDANNTNTTGSNTDSSGNDANNTDTTGSNDDNSGNDANNTTDSNADTNGNGGNIIANKPIANDENITINEDTVSNITLSASDADNDALSYVIVSPPQHGTISLANNIATYSPNSNYVGNDSFTFKANDGTLDSAPATIAITLAPVNDAPTISHNHTAQTDEDQSVEITLLAEDIEDDTLSYVIVSNPSNGTVTLTSVNGVTKATYTPNTDYHGNDTFSFKANDGEQDSIAATVTLTVNAIDDAPIANNGSVTTDKNVSKAITLTANDVDTDNATLTYNIETQPEHGSVTLNLNGAIVNYTPTTDYTGNDTFTFSVTDGTTRSNIATVTINVIDTQTTMKILPLGDSITHTHVSQISYRYLLWKMLLDRGSDFDLIGSKTTRYGSGTRVAQPDHLGQAFDRDHEAVAGIRADRVLSNLDGLLQTYTPDVVLLHLGTNDIFQGQSTSSTVADLEGIIGKLRADNANVTVFLAKIIPAASAMNGVIDLNNQLDGLANRLNTANSPVIIVDMFSNFSASNDTYDGTHPNRQGDQKMAQRWFDAMINNGIF